MKIKIDARYRPHQISRSTISGRFAHPYLFGGRLIASDGIIMASYPVEIEGSAPDKTRVHADLFLLHEARRKQCGSVSRFMLIEDGVSCDGITASLGDTVEPPDPTAALSQPTGNVIIRIDAYLLARLVKALGSHSGRVTLLGEAAGGPVRVDAEDTGGAFGIIMPLSE